MLERHFHLRLKCNYNAPDNAPTDLAVEVYTDNKWEVFSPHVDTPGFLLFVYALFSCQLRYMRVNCAERNIMLESTTGEIQLLAGENWNVKSVFVTFRSIVKSNPPEKDDISYISERMKHCPVSTNLPDSVEMKNDIVFE